MQTPCTRYILQRYGANDANKITRYITAIGGIVTPPVISNLQTFQNPQSGNSFITTSILPVANSLLANTELSRVVEPVVRAYVGDMLLNNLAQSIGNQVSANTGIVTTAGVNAPTIGTVVSSGTNGTIAGGLNYALDQLGIGNAINPQYGNTAIGLATPVIAPIIGSQLGLEGDVLTSGIGGTLATVLSPYVTEYVNQYVGGLIPEAIVRGALSSALTKIITPTANYLLG